MSEQFEIAVFGLDEIDARLGRLSHALAVGAMTSALAFSALPTLRLARLLAPYGATRKTGKHLRDRITIQRIEPRGGLARVRVVSSAPHSHLVEKGHRIVARGTAVDYELRKHFIAAGGRRSRAGKWRFQQRTGKGGPALGRTKAQPYMRPAWEQTKADIPRLFAVEIKSLLKGIVAAPTKTGPTLAGVS